MCYLHNSKLITEIYFAFVNAIQKLKYNYAYKTSKSFLIVFYNLVQCRNRIKPQKTTLQWIVLLFAIYASDYTKYVSNLPLLLW